MKTNKLPLLPIRDIVMLPTEVVHLEIGRKKSALVIEELTEKNRIVFFTTQKNKRTEDPSADDFFRIGTIGIVEEIKKLDGGRISIIVNGVKRAVISSFIKEEPYFEVEIQEEPDNELTDDDYRDIDAIWQLAKDSFESYARHFGKNLSEEVIYVRSSDDLAEVSYVIMSNISKVSITQRQNFLEEKNPRERLKICIAII